MAQRNQWAPITEERLAEAKAMLDDHCSVAEVMRTTGMDRATIYKYLGKRCWSFREAAQHGVVLKQAREAGLL